MKRILCGAAIVMLSLTGCAETQRAADTTVAAAKAQVNPTLSTTDATFMTMAARGGMAEVQLGQLAQTRGSSAAVKRFGERMVREHGEANQAMMALARQKEITPPDTVGADQQQIYDNLSKLRGRAFDRAFAQAMVQNHQQDLQAYQEEAQNGTDPDVKAFAARHVPILQEHLRMAEQLPQR